MSEDGIPEASGTARETATDSSQEPRPGLSPPRPGLSPCPGAQRPMGEGEMEDDDALALQLVNRAQARAWDGGYARSRLRGRAADEEGVAAWDSARRPREAGRAVEATDDEDRGPGLAPGRDRPGPTRFDPRPGGDELARVFSERGWAGKLAMAHLAVRWEHIVGPQVAEHARVVSFEVGRLEVQASSSAWAQQLRLLLPRIEAAVERELARVAGTGTRVEIRVLGPVAPSWGRGRFGAARGGRGPRDTYG